MVIKNSYNKLKGETGYLKKIQIWGISKIGLNVFVKHILTIFNKNKKILERSAIKIEKNENVHDNFIHA